eukprot:12915062-Prorocentrum_lima.AAC.1
MLETVFGDRATMTRFHLETTLESLKRYINIDVIEEVIEEDLPCPSEGGGAADAFVPETWGGQRHGCCHPRP